MSNFLKRFYYAIVRFLLRARKENNLKNLYIKQKYKKSFIALKDTHKGKRCFIIGNGPSLTAGDLSLLKNEYTFAANRIYYMFDKTTWRPTFYCAQDQVVIDDIIQEFPKVLKETKKMFLISDCYDNVDASLKSNKDVLFFCAKYVAAHKERIYSSEIDKYISGGGTITYTAIQIATYMGFDEIYLIGVDHNYSMPSLNSDKRINSTDVHNSYFEGMPSNIKVTAPNTDNSTLSFIAARDYCNKHGIKIFNATRGGMLEVYPRIKLEDILNG